MITKISYNGTIMYHICHTQLTQTKYDTNSSMWNWGIEKYNIDMDLFKITLNNIRNPPRKARENASYGGSHQSKINTQNQSIEEILKGSCRVLQRVKYPYHFDISYSPPIQKVDLRGGIVRYVYSHLITCTHA